MSAYFSADFDLIVNLQYGILLIIFFEIVEIIQNLSGKRIKDLNKPVSGPMNFVCDMSLIKKLTGWEPKYSIEEGLAETYEIMKRYKE